MVASRNNLITGNAISCGCVRKQNIARVAKNKKIKVHPFSSLYRDYKNHSKEKNREFNLSLEEFKNLCLGNCHYCNTEPRDTHKYGGRGRRLSFLRNGVDRIDSSGGYTKDNTVSCCAQCNRAKRDSHIDDFEDWIRKAYWHFCVDKHFE